MLFRNGNAIHPAETTVGPIDGVLRLHQIARSIGSVRGTAVPTLRILEVNVACLAENRHRALPFKLGMFLTVRLASRKVASWNILCGALFDRLDVGEGHLDCKPKHGRSRASCRGMSSGTGKWTAPSQCQFSIATPAELRSTFCPQNRQLGPTMASARLSIGSRKSISRKMGSSSIVFLKMKGCSAPVSVSALIWT